MYYHTVDSLPVWYCVQTSPMASPVKVKSEVETERRGDDLSELSSMSSLDDDDDEGRDGPKKERKKMSRFTGRQW